MIADSGIPGEGEKCPEWQKGSSIVWMRPELGGAPLDAKRLVEPAEPKRPSCHD